MAALAFPSVLNSSADGFKLNNVLFDIVACTRARMAFALSAGEPEEIVDLGACSLNIFGVIDGVGCDVDFEPEIAVLEEGDDAFGVVGLVEALFVPVGGAMDLEGTIGAVVLDSSDNRE